MPLQKNKSKSRENVIDSVFNFLAYATIVGMSGRKMSVHFVHYTFWEMWQGYQCKLHVCCARTEGLVGVAPVANKSQFHNENSSRPVRL